MFNFFISKQDSLDDEIYLKDNNYHHAINVLRMKVGDKFLVSYDGKNDLCEIYNIDSSLVKAKIIEPNYNDTTLPIEIYLFQGLPKSDKLELIIQKCVELGIKEIYPVQMNRCVVKLDAKKDAQKNLRWQTIAESAAKQSKCTFIPKVNNVISFDKALTIANELDILLVPYESKDGMQATISAMKKIKSGMKVGIMIGSEGGFDPIEIEKAVSYNAEIISLGKRILRTETAAITAVSMVMLHAECLDLI